MSDRSIAGSTPLILLVAAFALTACSPKSETAQQPPAPETTPPATTAPSANAAGASSLLYVGDAVHHFIVSVQRPEWTINFDTDAATAEMSRSALLAQTAASGQRIYAVHFPFPGLGKIEQRGEGFVWVAE